MDATQPPDQMVPTAGVLLNNRLLRSVVLDHPLVGQIGFALGLA
jgi:hypothetical protein